DLAGREFSAHLRWRERTDLLAIDHQVPYLIGARGWHARCRRAAAPGGDRLLIFAWEPGVGRRASVARRFHIAVGAATDDDDVAALFATDFEDLPANLLVRDRVLRRAIIANDLHGAPSWIGHDILGASVVIRKHLPHLTSFDPRHHAILGPSGTDFE